MPHKPQRTFPPLVRAPKNYWTGPTDGTTFGGYTLDDLTDVNLTGAVDGDFLQRVSGVWVPVDAPAGSSDPIDLLPQLTTLPRALYWLYDDFDGGSQGGRLGTFASGTSAAVTAWPTSTALPAIGVTQMTTGSTATGRAEVLGGALVLGTTSGEWFFESRVAVADGEPDGSNQYFCRTGFVETTATPASNQGAFFLYDKIGVVPAVGGVASANWQCLTWTGASITRTDSGVPVAFGFPGTPAWTRMTIEVNDDGTQCDFSIDGSAVASHTTNIPTSAVIYPKIEIHKNLGTGSREINADYINVVCLLNNQR